MNAEKLVELQRNIWAYGKVFWGDGCLIARGLFMGKWVKAQILEVLFLVRS